MPRALRLALAALLLSSGGALADQALGSFYLNQDDASICANPAVNPCTVSAAGVLAAVDAGGYNSATVEIVSNPGANVISFETCDDLSLAACSANSTWVLTPGLVTTSTGLAQAVTTTSNAGPAMFAQGKAGRFMRWRVSTYVSGAVTILGNLHVAPRQVIGGTQSLGPTNAGNIGNVGMIPYNTGQTFVSGTSGNVANAVATATCPAVAAKTNFLTSFDITATGATAGSVVTPTITGVLGGTRSLTLAAPAGATTMATPIMASYANAPLQGAGVNTAITLTLPALGVGATNATVNVACILQ